MAIKRVKLISKHHYNFRDGVESPIVIGVVSIKRGDGTDRLCYEVCYASDGKIDYIPLESVRLDHWGFDDAN